MKISIITATYNNEATINCALDSVAMQDYLDLEHLIIDGASTDNTLSIIRAHHNKNIRIISEPDEGIYFALNKGIEKANGEIIGFLHSDDLFESPSVIRKIVEEFNVGSIDAVYGDLVYVKKSNVNEIIRFWRAGPYKIALLKMGWMPPHPTFYTKKSIYKRFGGFDLRYNISADYDLMLRFLFKGMIRVAYIPEVLVRMRLGGISNRSFKNIFIKSFEDFMIVRRNDLGGIIAVVQKNISKVQQYFNL
jgi:glycosyltransferase